MDVTTDEVIAELRVMVPETVDRAALRVANRKLIARIAELTERESPHGTEETEARAARVVPEFGVG